MGIDNLNESVKIAIEKAVWEAIENCVSPKEFMNEVRSLWESKLTEDMEIAIKEFNII